MMTDVQANTALFYNDVSYAFPVYRIAETPIARAARTSNGVDIAWSNRRSAYSVRVYQATGIRNNFSNIQNVTSQEQTTFAHAGVQAGRAYKYKVSYFVKGNIAGSLVEHEGVRCAPIYLLEEQE